MQIELLTEKIGPKHLLKDMFENQVTTVTFDSFFLNIRRIKVPTQWKKLEFFQSNGHLQSKRY